jgi:hypothetical protein
MIRKSSLLKILQALRESDLRRSDIYRLLGGHRNTTLELDRILTSQYPHGLAGLIVQVKTSSALRWYCSPLGMTWSEFDPAPTKASTYEPDEARQYRLRQARRERNSDRRKKASTRARKEGINPAEYKQTFEGAEAINWRDAARLSTVQRIQWLRSRAGLNS